MKVNTSINHISNPSLEEENSFWQIADTSVASQQKVFLLYSDFDANDVLIYRTDALCVSNTHLNKCHLHEKNVVTRRQLLHKCREWLYLFESREHESIRGFNSHLHLLHQSCSVLDVVADRKRLSDTPK